ncbi:MAG: pyruvate kinase [Candidatus Nanopelagicales bacterium]|jgi:pyruvate kinase|nr:pyruvate kinase [Candidatus Nanopelagicales bacterium]MBJ7393498.1 pyruvate kinase [Candidatus Nanopelagicales bacterium]
MRRAKIVATLGPATDDLATVQKLIKAGLNVARLNMSHGDHADHKKRLGLVRAAAKLEGKEIAALADLQGPKIRVGTFGNGPVSLVNGQNFIITIDDVIGDKEKVSTTYKGLTGDVKKGDPILIDDGKIRLEVIEVKGNNVLTKIIEGGTISNSKGINLPGVAVNVPAMSDKDEADLIWALDNDCDLIALSFVRSAKDIENVHKIMDKKGKRLPIVAKIEKPQAVENLGEILQVFDAIMIARGDLGVELPYEVVPMVQKRAIQMARQVGKPVIVATQMLESMINSSRPTRAEASDVANAVLDGADALMLSGETSVGDNPVGVVETMARIIEHVEVEALEKLPKLESEDQGSTGRAVTTAAVAVGKATKSKYLIAFTETGRSVRLMARHRSSTQILAFTTDEKVQRQLAMIWGTETFHTDTVQHTDDMVATVDRHLTSNNLAKYGELVVVVAGVPPGVPGTTNGMRVHKVGTGADES